MNVPIRTIEAARETISEARDALRAALDPASPWAGNALTALNAALDHLAGESRRLSCPPAAPPPPNGRPAAPLQP